MTMPVTMNAIENSGSLTGHILAQGWDRGVDTNRRSNVKVALAMLAVLVFLVGVSLLFLFTAGDAFTDMVNDVFNKGRKLVEPDAAPTDVPTMPLEFSVAAFRLGHSMVRGEYNWKMLNGDWQLSAEAAFNRYNGAAHLFDLDPAGVFAEIPFPAGTGGVTEDRYESILTHGRQLAPNLSLQIGGGAEYSLTDMFYVGAGYRYSNYGNHTARQRLFASAGIRFK